MAVNRDKPDLWKSDVAQSVDMYNQWFLDFAPAAFRTTRVKTTQEVEHALRQTDLLRNVKPEVLKRWPEVLPTLRMSICPPLAADRLIGLSGVPSNLVKTIEHRKKMPDLLESGQLDAHLRSIGAVIERLADPDIFVWLGRKEPATEVEVARAATIVADRLCGAVANPIIRNAQEQRQLASIAAWLQARGYVPAPAAPGLKPEALSPGTFSFHLNIPVKLEDARKQINLPIEAVIMPRSAAKDDFPLLFEAKSAGDYTNVNKRRKEEAAKMSQLRRTYGSKARLNLFLCGYFDAGYLGYEAAEGIDWVWEHRLDDLEQFGL